MDFTFLHELPHQTMVFVMHTGFYSPKSWVKIGHNFPPV